MLNFTIAGNLGADATVESLQTGKKIINFSVGVNRQVKTEFGDYKKETTWVKCTYYPPESSSIAQYLKKGQAVAVTGKGYVESFVNRQGERQSILKCVASEITLQGYAGGAMQENEKQAATQTQKKAYYNTPSEARAAAVTNNPVTEDLPF